MKQLEERLSSKIVSQAKEIAELKADNEKLKAALAVQERRFNSKIEEIEQYGRRLCLRVDGLPIKDQESADSVLADIKQELNKSGINVPDHAIDRAHRTGPKRDKQDRTTLQQAIIRFTSWSWRTKVYRARKNCSLGFRIDLTKIRLKLLTDARKMIENKEGVDFVFADVNCRLTVKLSNGSFRFFSTLEELHGIIDDI